MMSDPGSAIKTNALGYACETLNSTKTRFAQFIKITPHIKPKQHSELGEQSLTHDMDVRGFLPARDREWTTSLATADAH